MAVASPPSPAPTMRVLSGLGPERGSVPSLSEQEGLTYFRKCKQLLEYEGS